ncbi:extracellular matrix-binding ebh [Babesia caballi]|uniref:Extracellular matrix-binding ebh n=1 Tax=Babesia caballi TaxID=5871 RepID=A0AAV4LYE4_BABCB|nr:extracellular matrix-binding ebh [Babesia caballi]
MSRIKFVIQLWSLSLRITCSRLEDFVVNGVESLGDVDPSGVQSAFVGRVDCDVTGKDGAPGVNRNGDLARAVKGLEGFKEAINAAANKLTQSGGDATTVSQALEKLKASGTLGELIEKLADGLRVFIGYDNKGQGIALVIDPLQQLRKGVLVFLSEVIKKLKDNFRHTNVLNSNDVNNALSNAYSNRDNVTFDSAMGTVQSTLKDGKIKEVVTALKNVNSLKSNQNNIDGFSDAVSTYLTGVLNAVNTLTSNQVDSLKSSLPSLVAAYGKQNGEFNTKIKAVEDDYKKLSTNRSSNIPDILTSAVHNGTRELLKQLKKDGYKSSYLSTSNWSGNTNKNKIAQIFLGCLPLYYYWLTYLYWKCKLPQKEGGWEGQKFNRPTLQSYMAGHGYLANHFNKGKGASDIVNLIGSLDQFSNVGSSPNPSHPDMLTELDNSLKGVIRTGSSSAANLDGHSLSALFYLCRCYFTGKQITNPVTERRPPTSIREMLYWLSGLQFSPHYYDIQKQIDNIVPDHSGLHVADSSAKSKDPLTRNQMKGYLKTSCLSAPGVLGAIQGNIADSEENEPWLYHLFSNGLNLTYASSAAVLFHTLADYAYALQFQLYFLYRQCANSYTYTCGWNECRYGSGVTGEGLKSHLCPKGCNRSGHGHSNGDHSGCKHDDCSNQSPLQAFLTDNLKGFCRQQPGTSNHLTECSDRSMCHVPMGFAGKLRTDAGGGLNIAYALNPFCGGPSDPLRQLSEKLGCLTKRTPRTLGDLLGFIWHLNGQLFKSRPRMGTIINAFIRSFDLGTSLSDTFNNDRYSAITSVWNKISRHTLRSSTSSSGLALSLEAMAPQIPFLYQLFMAEEPNTMPGALFDLTKHCHRYLAGDGPNIKIVHKSHSGSSSISGHRCSEPSDLWSIFQGLDTKPSGNNTDKQAECRRANCGGYLSPLTHTYGATYSPNFASTYLSWVVYLVEVFNERLQELLVEFNDINCKDCGPHCSCTKGQHGTTNCSCHSVVSCAGVLPVLYGHGFNFTNAYTLKGGTHGNDPMKRNCKKFQTALSNILKAEAPLHTLLTTIDDFLYMFRIYFFYNLSTFWIMYVCIVLYIYFLRADLLHLKSHVHFPSSHGIPSIGLLPTGQPTVMTKFTKLTYFTP